MGVEKFDLSRQQNQIALSLIVEAARDACKTVQASPIQRPRPNEVGNDMEPHVIAALNAIIKDVQDQGLYLKWMEEAIELSNAMNK